MSEASNESVSYSVLLVEDNKDNAEAFRLFLEILGHEPIVAFTGLGAVEALKRSTPDIILCDLNLPGEYSGLDVASSVRALDHLASIPLVAMTAYSLLDVEDDARAAGFDLVLIKPVLIEDVERVIAQLLKG